MKLMSMEFPLSTEIMTPVRLVTGGICALSGFDLDDAEDCKVCVTESLLLLSRRGGKNVQVCFEQEEGGLKISFEAEGDGKKQEKPAEEEISVALLSALVSNLEISTKEKIMSISFGIGKL